jgi:hypothetical protein
VLVAVILFQDLVHGCLSFCGQFNFLAMGYGIAKEREKAYMGVLVRFDLLTFD